MAASLALANASVPMYGIVTAVTMVNKIFHKHFLFPILLISEKFGTNPFSNFFHPKIIQDFIFREYTANKNYWTQQWTRNFLAKRPKTRTTIMEW